MPERLEDWKKYDESISELKTVSGIGRTTAVELYKADYMSVRDLKQASQEELSQVSSVGNALAARIKADVGNREEDDDSYHGIGRMISLAGMEAVSSVDVEELKRLYPSLAPQLAEEESVEMFDGPISEYTER